MTRHGGHRRARMAALAYLLSDYRAMWGKLMTFADPMSGARHGMCRYCGLRIQKDISAWAPWVHIITGKRECHATPDTAPSGATMP